MRLFRLAGVGVLAFLGLSLAGVALAETPTVPATQIPTPGLPATPSPSVAPAPTATATPPSGAIYKGRPCGVGRLIHDFLIIQEPPPGPRPTCVEPVTSTAPERLYRLRSVPAGLFFDGVMRDDSRGQGLVYVIYKSTADPEGAPAVQIVLRRVYGDPEPLLLRDASIATAADFLPLPGVALRDDPVLREAMWHEAAGSHRISINPRRTSLTLEEAAALLEPFVPEPGAPATGTGYSVSQGRGPGVLPAALVLLLSFVVGWATWRARKRLLARRI